MASSFPNGLDSFTDPLATDTLDDPDHAILHADINDAVEKLEAKVGINSSGDATSLDALVRSAMPVGSLTAYVGTSAPDSSWVVCNGAAIDRTTYATLFALIGTTYGSGDGSTMFNVPDLRGRVIAGFDSLSGTFGVLGGTGGAESVALTGAETGSHSHDVASHTHAIDHNHASATSASGGAAHTHSANHDHGSKTSSSSGNAHTHAVDPPSTTSTSDSHSHSGSFGTSTHRHYVQAALGDYYYAASAGNAGWTVYGMSTYGVGWNGATHITNRSETVNSASGYVSVSHGIYQTTGQTYTPTSNAGVGSDSHTHATNIASFTSGGASATTHTHSVNLPSIAVTSGSTTASHTHDVDLPNFTGTSGGTALTTDAGGNGDAHNNIQPFMALNWIMKAA